MVDGVLWSSGSSVAVKVIGLVTSFTIISVLSVHDYGLYQLALAAYGIVLSFFFSGFDQVALTEIMRARGVGDERRADGLFNEFMLWKVVAGVVLFLLLIAGANFADYWYQENIASLLRILSILIPVIACERVLNMIFNMHLSFRAISLFTLAEESAKLIFLAFLLFAANLGVEGVIIATTLGTTTAFLIFLPVGLRLYVPRFSSGLSPVGIGLGGIFLVQGKWAVGYRYLNDFQRNIRPWLIKTFISTEAVGIFSLALNLYGNVVGLLPIGSVLGPVTAREAENTERIRRLLLVSLKYGTILFVALGVVAAVGVPLLVEFLFPRYIESIPLFWALLLTIMTSSAAFMFSSLFYGYREQRSGFFIMLVAVFFTLIAGPVLLSVFGIWGITFEFILGAYFFNILRLRYLFGHYPELRIKLRDFFSWGKDDKEFVSGVIRIGLQATKFVKK